MFKLPLDKRLIALLEEPILPLTAFKVMSEPITLFPEARLLIIDPFSDSRLI